MISVVCPTYNRSERHANLYQVFQHQTFNDRELIVLDDSEEASPFFSKLNDPKVTYQHLPSRHLLGEKRNILAEMAKGDVIAQFDDDDYYAPKYLETMISLLSSADFGKLSKWLSWKEGDGTLWEWDTRFKGGNYFRVAGWEKEVQEIHSGKPTEEVPEWDSNLWGFGFSFIYKKSLWKDSPFVNRNSGEDFAFVDSARRLGKICVHSPDYPHLALHTLHAQSSSLIFPQTKLEPLQILEIFGAEVKPWLI